MALPIYSPRSASRRRSRERGVVDAAILAVESLVFIFVHVKYPETATIVMSAVLGLLMAFVTYGRLPLEPLL